MSDSAPTEVANVLEAGGPARERREKSWQDDVPRCAAIPAFGYAGVVAGAPRQGRDAGRSWRRTLIVPRQVNSKAP